MKTRFTTGDTMKTRFIFNDVIDRLKKALKINLDCEIAERLNMKAGTFNARKKTGSLPYEEILTLAELEKIDYNWLLTGEGEMRKKPAFDIQKQEQGELDNEQLTLAIETVEEVLEEAEKTMLPKKKALLIMAVYDLFKDEDKPMKQPVLKLVRSAFA